MSEGQWTSFFLLDPRVLVVDDDRDFARTAAGIIGKGGARVEVAHDGVAGLVAVRSFDPDVVVCDLSMPLMRGDAMLSELRKGGYRKPFILLTGFAELSHVADALHLNAFDYLVKPVSSKVLVAAVQNALRSEHQRLLREEELQELRAALARYFPESATTTWQEEIREKAVAAVRERRLARQRATGPGGGPLPSGPGGAAGGSP